VARKNTAEQCTANPVLHIDAKRTQS